MAILVLANTSSSNAGQLINKLSNICVIGLGAWLVVKNELTLGQLIAFRIISGYVTQPMLRLSGSWQQFQEMSLSLQRIWMSRWSIPIIDHKGWFFWFEA